MISVGNGFFKPNISTIVGSLYEQGDRRRDAGFTIFYMGINLGSILGQLFCPLLADWFGWWAGLSLAGVGMLVSYVLIQFDGGRLGGYGERPDDAPEPRHRHLRLCAARRAGRRVPVQQPDELAAAAEPGSGFIGYLAVAVADGQVAVRHLHRRRVPASSSGPSPRARAQRSADDDRGDGPDHLQRLLLDPVRAGGLVADPVRRPQHRPQRVRAVQPVRAADAELQPDLHRPLRAADEHACGLAWPSAGSSRRSRSSSRSR